MKKNKKLKDDNEYVYGQAIIDVPKKLKNIIVKIPLYKSLNKTNLFECIGYSPKHKIMRIRFAKFDDYPFDYAYTNIDADLYTSVDSEYGGNRLRYDIIPYISKYPCYKLDASKSKAKILERPTFKQINTNSKEFEIGDRVEHFYFGKGTILDVQYVNNRKNNSIDIYYDIQFDNLETSRCIDSKVLT